MEECIDKLKKTFSKKMTLSLSLFVILIFSTIILSAITYYTIGKNDGYAQKNAELKAQERALSEQALMEKPYIEVKDTFLKFLMVKTMSNIEIVFYALLFILILRAIF